MNHDERHQQELEEQAWYEFGPGSETCKQHQRFRKELKEMEEDCADREDHMREVWNAATRRDF